MSKLELNRRTFIKGTIGAGLALSASPLFISCSTYDAKGLPTAILGRTGVEVPKIAFGLGSRYCTIDSEEEALDLLTYALDNGLYYWDTAHSYVNKKNGVVSEERLGKILKDRRDEIFLSTKLNTRDTDEAMRQLELSLKRLQTDKLDVLKIHAVSSMEDVDQLCSKGQMVELMHKLKDEGITRFVGFSGHSNAGAMKAMAERADLDVMLIAMNHWGNHKDDRRNVTIPAALDKGMGVMLMKAVRPKDNDANYNGNELVRFALSLNGPAGLTVGMESKEIVQKNLDLLRNFTPMNEAEKEKMARSLDPFFKHKNLEWMHHGYEDGTWA